MSRDTGQDTGSGGECRENVPGMEEFMDDIIGQLRCGGVETKEDLLDLKMVLCRRYRMPRIPRDSEILARVNRDLPREEAERLLPLLRKKPYRTASGIAAVAVMTSPHECPHGTCAYCPGGPEKGTAQSYTGREPASLRAHSHAFDPYGQVRSRVEQLEAIGHPTDKVELIIMGGTFTARERDYQDGFIEGCFRALNGGGETGNPPPTSSEEPAVTHGDWPGLISPQLLKQHELNESAKHRCIGMTIETRPDRCGPEETDLVLAQGGTRVELGVQTLHDDILEGVKRGHNSATTARTTALLKDAGLKVGYHMMPFLPGSDEELELESFRRVFGDARYRPDLLKIYPTLVMEGTPLHRMWEGGEYSAPDTGRAAKLIARVKEEVPHWMRISRIQRDIPRGAISAGVDMGNLRQVVAKVMEGEGKRCRCIRCREVGHRLGPDAPVDFEGATWERTDYEASGGKEVFISSVIAEHDALVGFVRLRLPSQDAHRPELSGGEASVIRELKVLGPMAPIPGGGDGLWQHRGLGEELIRRAAGVSAGEWGARRMLVTSGVGARPYYKKLGFERSGPYMRLDL